MRVCVISDEISGDPETAIELATEWGIRHFEIRRLFGKRVPDTDVDQLKHLKNLLDQTNTDVVAVSPGLFKVRIDDKKAVKEHLTDRLPRSIEAAKFLGAALLIVFGLIGEKQEFNKRFEEIASTLGEAADQASEENMVLALENEPICLVDTGGRAARTVSEVNKENLVVNWDPGNSCIVGRELPFPDGYQQVKDLIGHVHLKNCIFDSRAGSKRWAPLSQGEIPICNQIEALRRDGYEHFISLETHLKPRVRRTRENWETLLEILGGMGEKPE